MPISQSTRFNPFLRTLGLALAVLMIPSIAHGQADRAWFVVQNDSEPVRCMDQEIYYTVDEYAKGTVVRADGTSGDYTKIRYPAGLGAFVPARDAQSIDGGKRVRLTDASQLTAASMLRGFDRSWCPVFAEPLKAGTELAVIEVMKDGNDEVAGYRVLPPAPSAAGSYAYLYIRTNSLRPATASEIKAAQSGKPAAGRPKLTAGPEHTKVVQDSTPVKPLPEPAQAETKPAAEVVDLRDEMVIPTTNDSEPLETTDSPSNSPAVIKNTIPVVVSPEKSGRARLTASGLEALEASFVQARLMPREQLDEALPELLAEFTRTRNAAGDDDSVIRPLDQRIEWLNIRIQTRDQRRAIAQTLSVADQQSLLLNGKIERWNATRVYALVGRLMLSGVYTGEHLPLLYRVRAPDPITGLERTVGYLAPTPDQDLRRYLGQVIGVVGDPVHDEALSMTVLSPKRIDRMPGQ